jgi:hypothetical protein
MEQTNKTDISTKEAKRIYDTVKRIFDQQSRQLIKNNNLIYALSAIVTAYNSTTKIATVYFAGDDSGNTTTLKNKSNETLAAGNEVYVFCIGSLTNAYVAIKK